ncbi:MAG: PEP-CTERM sorting domain-containing protein [Thiobacillus sp.]|nr:MAG: PEP-CTERM sorting domain-containing protein [Thiobacillus sp.]
MLQADFANLQNFADFTYTVASLNDVFNSTVSISVSAVPEPGMSAMLASGLGMLVVAARRKRRE